MILNKNYNEQLKECPFCGGESGINGEDINYSQMLIINITCSQCGASISVAGIKKEDEQLVKRASKKWNKRV